MKKAGFLLMSMIFLASCGSGGAESAASEETSPRPAPKAAPAAEESVEPITLELSASDQMKFDKDRFLVKEGQEVTLNLTHAGEMEKAVMGHNFVLLAKGTDLADFAGRAASAKDSDYIPEGDEVLAHTGLIGGGESTSVTFTAPARGQYDFICSFPGHYALMKGKLIVQ